MNQPRSAKRKAAARERQGKGVRFKAAQNLVRTKAGTNGDHIEASIIDTRLRAVQSLLREQALER